MSEVGTGEEVTRGDLLRALVEVTAHVTALEMRIARSERQHPETAVEELRVLMNTAIELWDELRGLDEQALPEPTDAPLEEWWEERSQILDPPRVADICFAGGFELRRASRELLDAREPDEVAVAAESARRKLARGVRALLAAAREGDVPVDSIAPPDFGSDDLQSALAVRRIYQRFRRALRRSNAETPEAVLEALRYAAGALAALVADPSYVHVRASDRALLRRLHERILAWARHDRPTHLGLQLLEDVHTCSNLLRGINQRQELQAHDAALFAILTAGPGSNAEAFGAQLEGLVGRDERLDDAIEAWRQQATNANVERLVERLRELAPP